MVGTIKDPQKDPTKTKEKKNHIEIFRQNIGPLRKIQWFAHQFDSIRMMENQLNHLVNLDLPKHKWILDGEFLQSKIRPGFNLIFRAMSLESILDSESVAADGGHVTLRIKPGVYQKRPDVVLAEIDHKR